MLRIFPLLLLFSAVSGLSLANDKLDFHSRGIDSSSGLPAHWIRAIHKDKRGFVWLGSWEGLIRYDGAEFKVYKNKPSDKNSLSDNLVSVIHEDDDAVFWLGTVGGGLVRFDSKSETFETFRHDPSNSDSISSDVVVSIYETSDGLLWIGTWGGGLNVFDKRTKKFVVYVHDKLNTQSISGNAVTAVIEANDNSLWVLTRYAGLNKFNRQSKQFERFSLGENREGSHWGQNIFYKAVDNSIYFVTRKALHKIDAQSEQLTHFPRPRQDIILNGLMIDDSQTIWVHGLSNNESVFEFDPETGEFTSYNIDAEVYVAYKDNDGVVWLGTRDQGLLLYDIPIAQRFKHIHALKNGEDGYLGDSLRALYTSESDQLWIVTSESVTRYDPQYKTFEYYDKNTISNNGEYVIASLFSIVQDSDGLVWLGGSDMQSEQGMLQLNPETREVKKYSHQQNDPNTISSDVILTVISDSKNRVWAGTDNGLNLYDKENDRFERFFPSGSAVESPSNNIRTIYETKDGLLWLGSWYVGARVFDPETKEFIEFDQNSPMHISNTGATAVYSILESSDGIIWFGTANGLISFDRKNNVTQRYSSRDGLPSDAIMGIVEGGENEYWVSTRQGMVLLNSRTKEVLLFDRYNGLSGGEYLENAYAVDKQGNTYFGTNNGIDIIPNNFSSALRKASEPVITSILIDHQELEVPANVTQGIAPWASEKITLPTGRKAIGFTLSPLEYTAPHKVKYRYRLDPLQEQWIEIDNTKRYVSYPEIAPGQYTFLFDASDAMGRWDNDLSYRSVKVNVEYEWWQSWWFYLLSCLAFILLAASFRHAQLKSKIEALAIQEKVNQSEETMRLLLGSTSEAFFGSDDTGKCIFSNPACANILKVESPEHMLGMDMNQFFAPVAENEDILDFAGEDNVLPMDLNVRSSESYTKFKNLEGSVFPVSYSVQPLSLDGQVTGSVVRFIDATQTLANVRTSRRNQRMELFGQLIDGIAHDFNNHLSVIGVSLELLEIDLLSAADRGDIITRIQSSVESASALSNKLVTLSDTQELVARAVDFNQTVEMLRPLISTTLGERIKTDIQLADQQLFCMVDEEQLRNCILNLVINARHAIEENPKNENEMGQVIVRIGSSIDEADGSAFSHGVKYQADAQYVSIVVEDSGSGLSDSVKDKIFEPFYTTKSIGKGSGLGLAIVSSFVEQSGGFISARNMEGGGACFGIHFPRIENVGIRTVSAKQIGASPKVKQGRGEKILIVEDYEANLVAMRDLLLHQNYVVYCAKDVPEARHIFEQVVDLDCLITDIVLPSKMDGRDLYLELKHQRTDLHAIFISGYAEKRDLGQLEDIPWLKKPLNSKRMLEELQYMFNRVVS